MSHAYTEDQLVELPAKVKDLLAEFRFCARFVHLLLERNERAGFPELSSISFA